MVAEYLTLDRLATQLSEIKHQHFSGHILLKSTLGHEWCLYVYLGRILYATGGSHPIRRWVRNSTLAGVDVSTAEDLQVRIEALTNVSALTPTELNSCWEYYLLVNWAKQGRIGRDALIKHIQTTIVEVLFDIVQAEEVSYEQIDRDRLSPQLTLIDLDRAFGIAVQQQQQWQQVGLAEILPDRAIKIVAPTDFQQIVSPSAYQALRFVLDGEHSIREIAAKARKTPVAIGQSFRAHLDSGMLSLVDLPDFTSPIASSKHSRSFKSSSIVCIDDSPFVCDRLEQIFKQEGYQFISVMDSLKAIPIVVAKKPDLIFLDLVMPNANGYEICSRLRKIGAFQNTPIVILTGNDGVIDRVRAKVVGATDFLTKPVQSELVLEVARKYLSPILTK
ncbi:response regulator [Chamaesiphon minutus]|uniref:Response regulator containing a CheY-like receiver domain and a GGDEF domain n=1 Tax=Chamaesiphon minutus (strain ATCC 27169 / PCC 6605) TaxID=1173020 RepID=K9UIL3_CHAP6|nr:response regulator [Chamaesiphon minutus]AFY94650.1 response regulator containing a CheY-like receiver domain and a GGDEF domain [Chamaesiphon minutus PCC 6605]